jgi:site-specific recombinase XerD
MAMMNKSNGTDFARALSDYLLRYLPEQRGLSKNTIKSYSDAFTLFLDFCESELRIKRERLEIKDISLQTIEHFLSWLETARNNSASSRNQRNAALHSFFKYLQYKDPRYVLMFQQVMAMPYKSVKHESIRHLPLEAIEEIFKKPDLSTVSGRRDFAVLSLMYESAARVSEVVDLRIDSIRFERKGATITLCGKGRKMRAVPLISSVSAFLKHYLADEERHRPCLHNEPLFCNRAKGKLTRAGISYILGKYVEQVRATQPYLLPEKVYPHILRHSRAMHWLEAGVDLQYIKDLLGHVELSTTEVYARLNTEMKRKILEEVHPEKPITTAPSWSDDRKLMDWLKGFSES